MRFVFHEFGPLLVVSLFMGCVKPTVCTRQGFGCNECDPSESIAYTCEYDGVEATESACDECEAQNSLLIELCSQGYTEDWMTVLEDTTCTIRED